MAAPTRPSDRADQVRDELTAACVCRPATEADAIAGVPAQFVASPCSTDEVAAVLRVASRHRLAVIPKGHGTKLNWGAPPRRADLVLDLTGVAGVVEHAADDLVVVVRAGTAVRELCDVLAGSRQQLALDTPLPEASIGGTLAMNTSGPRRLRYGTARDLLIGITFVRADGVVAKAGGKVVKNVAGYDLGKLLIGSYGTLGVITEAAFRLHPIPAARRLITKQFPDIDTAAAAALVVLGSTVVPAAVEFEVRTGTPTRVAVLVEGVEAGVTRRSEAVANLLGADALVSQDIPTTLGAYPFSAADTGLKVTSSLRGVGQVLAAARHIAVSRDIAVHVRGSAAGVLYVGLPADTDPDAVATVVTHLRDVAARFDGSVTVLAAPASVRQRVDLWGPVPGLELMRRIKSEFDPSHRLSPGRFVGGI